MAVKGEKVEWWRELSGVRCCHCGMHYAVDLKECCEDEVECPYCATKTVTELCEQVCRLKKERDALLSAISLVRKHRIVADLELLLGEES